MLPRERRGAWDGNREGYLSMSTATTRSAGVRPPRTDLDRQIAQAKIVLRRLRDTLEDLDDRRELARAKKRNAGKQGTEWETVKKELGFEF